MKPERQQKLLWNTATRFYSHISQAPWAPWFTKYTCMS